MSKYTGDEKRNFVRIPVWFVTNYRVYPRPVEEFKGAIGNNISVGGICFEAREEFPRGVVLEIEIDMPALIHAVRAVGKVAWIKPCADVRYFLVGVEFIDIKRNDVLAIEEIIKTFS